MRFVQPAVRALQAKRQTAPDHVHVGRGPHIISSPGAGSGDPHLYYNNEVDLDHDGTTFFTTGTPVPTPIVPSSPAAGIKDVSTPTTIVGVSTSMATQQTLGGLFLSVPVPSPVLSTSSGIILSSSSSPPTTMTAVTSSTVLQSPASGSTTVPVRGGMASGSPPSQAADSGLAGAANSSSRPSGGVIAAVVIVLLLALCAVAFFVFRRYRIQRRVTRRATWTANLSPNPNFDASLEKGVDHDHTVSANAPIEMASQLSKEGGNGQEKALPPFRSIARKPPLPYSPVSPAAPSPVNSHNTLDARAPSMDSASVTTVVSTPVQDVPAIVRLAFIPQLPDELAITPGETLYIRTEFDDGWALCYNSRGKQGMVPLECLDGGGGQFAGVSHLRTMRRASSLNSAATWS